MSKLTQHQIIFIFKPSNHENASDISKKTSLRKCQFHVEISHRMGRQYSL